MNRKILFFTTGMTAGGAERVIATLSNALSERGCEVVIAMLKGDHSEYELSPLVRLHSAGLTPGLKNLPRATSFLRRLVRQEAPDIVVSFSTKSDIIALLSRVLFRMPGKLIVSDRADPYTRDKKMQLLCNLLYGRADALVCQSQSVADYYRENSNSDHIAVIPNPLNEDCVGLASSGTRAAEVLSIGRLSEQKDHLSAIKVFAHISEQFPELKLRIFGSGPLESELRDFIAQQGLQDSVFLEGIVTNVVRKHQTAALFLFTSTHEGYPNALLEAAATGIPCVTTDFSPGTAKEIVQDGVNGYIVPVADHDALILASSRVLSGELDPAKIAETAHHIREGHAVEHILDAWVSVFDRSISERARES